MWAYICSLEQIKQVIIGTSSISNQKYDTRNASCDLDKCLANIIASLATEPKQWTNTKICSATVY